MESVKISLTDLTRKVNKALGSSHTVQYISAVRHDKEGSPSLRKVVREVSAEILEEDAMQARNLAKKPIGGKYHE